MHPGQETIHVVTTLDSNYVQHCGVMLCSLFKNNLECRFKIWLIIDFNENRDLRKLRKFIANSNHFLEVIQTDGTLVKNFQTVHHITTATYYRLLIPDLIDQNLNRVIYLDIDIIIKKSILELWKYSLEDMIIAAVPEYGFNRHSELGLDEKLQYFNAGVLIINLVQWRSIGITSMLISFLNDRHQSLAMLEQDALNIILQNKWIKLSHEWNITTNIYEKYQELKEEIDIENPSIIHFTGTHKPWHSHCSHPQKKEYFRYLRSTPWKKFRLPEQTMWHYVKQQFKKSMNILFQRQIFDIYF